MELTDFLITFLSQLSLLVIGWFLAKRTVNSYQKKKEQREIRETIAELHSKAFYKLFDLILSWEEWLEDVESIESKKKLKERFFNFSVIELKVRKIVSKDI